MAKKLDPMDLKQILRLHLSGISNREISTTINIGRNTINNYVQFFKASEIDLNELLNYETSALEKLFSSKSTINNKRFDELMLYFEKVHDSRNHPGFTFLYHYNEYQSKVKKPYGYTQFMEHYNRRYAKLKGSMKLEHKVANELMIDYAGKHLYLSKPLTNYKPTYLEKTL